MASSAASMDSFMFTVGKLDAGMAILLGERAYLIEFPSILLPPGATTGSIVNISVNQNLTEEKKREAEFWELQQDILQEYGQASPEPPVLSVRNVTQTSVTLEWGALNLATAKLRSLDIYRNGERLSAVPSPLTNTSTKHSGMELNTDYTFQLILRTTAGTFPSNIVRVRTHTMQDTSGISVCFGNVQDPVLLENSKKALEAMGAKWSDKIQIDTSHFVCTTPAATPVGASAAGNNVAASAPGVAYQRALQLSIPVVQPQWILACHMEKRMIPIAAYYLGASTTPSSASFSNRPQSLSQANTSSSNVAFPTGQHPNSASASSSASRGPPPGSYRSSMPPPARSAPVEGGRGQAPHAQGPSTPPAQTSAFINQPASAGASTQRLDEGLGRPSQLSSQAEEDQDTDTVRLERTPTSPSNPPSSGNPKRRSKIGSMNREFKFPPVTPPPLSDHEQEFGQEEEPGRTPTQAQSVPVKIQAQPTTIDVPAPPPVEKERKSMSSVSLSEGEDDVGDIVEVDLN